MREILLAFIGSICPGVIYNVEKRNLIWVGFCGMLGWITYRTFNELAESVVLASFLGAVVVGIYSESVARLLKAPATVFSVPGIIPLVPGIGAYNTIQHIAENQLYEAASKGIETMSCAGAIAFGILLTSAVFRLPKKLKKRRPNPA
ncbi:MAG TPA: threonine/serine exporter [Clostridium sp.]|nr:hypothetical protein A7W90_06220 [Clostridium sp. Bc-iso-3]HHV30546.1 threonine/serine exporter [Clostridium sp.]